MVDASLTNVKGTPRSQDIVEHPKFFFDNTLVVIQIENLQFNVHKYQLLKSETFRSRELETRCLDMYAHGHVWGKLG
ncbi:unnamed protein product [Rhizoctonia solani]|uniref:BTB domain-containing protein n=1 Tax=Rhizoctonia solani TaxID=456999 RepID=A0A8H3B3Q9_9AGAM|nr:unnamed protein product [Rhizoctonia solani]